MTINFSITNKYVAYTLSILLTVSLIYIKFQLPHIFGQNTPFLFLTFPVIISAMIGGFGAGFVSLLITSIAVSYYFLFPLYSLSIETLDEKINVIYYFIQGLIIISLINHQRLTQLRLTKLSNNLEELVKERTKKLNSTVKKLNSSTDKLQLANVELKRSNKELQDFAYVASHDLQEPLRKIQSFGNLLAKEDIPKDSDAGLYVNRMLHAAGRMRVLIDDLLLYSRVTSKAQPFETVSLQKITEDVVSDLEARIKDRNAEVIINKIPDMYGDPTQMRQLIQNLVGNGLKFQKPDNAPKVTISGSNTLDASLAKKIKIGKPEEYMQLSISDNGIGLEEAYYQRIFTIFERLHGRQDYEGTGIGLSIVKKIVDRHNGMIEIRSKVGKGTTFVIALPKNRKEVKDGK